MSGFTLIKGTPERIDAELYDRFEEILGMSRDTLSDQQLGRMVALCETAYQKTQFRFYAIGRLGLKAEEVCGLVPCISQQELHKVVSFANSCTKRLRRPYTVSSMSVVYH